MGKEQLNKFNGFFEIDETYESNTWLRVKIRTFAFGKNRNGSDILNSSFSDFNKAKSTIGAVPIVAKYNEEKDDLEGHNVILRKNKNDNLEIYHDTDALGFTSPFTSFHFEEVNEGSELNPDYKTYVVVDDVYLWKRFDATKKIIEWFNEGILPRVSMEIDNVQGQFDKDGYFQIHDFEFTGIAALGTDVEPCFPKAEIQLYTVNEFKKDLKQLVYELGLNENSQEGGKGVEDVKQEFEEQVNETVDSEVVETEEQIDEVVEETVVTETEDTFEQTEEDTTEQVEETVEEDVQEESEVVDYESKFNELEKEFTKLQEELSDLKSYKRQREEQDLASKFADKLSEDEIKEVFESTKDLSLDVVEEKLLATFGKKNFSLESNTETVKVVAQSFSKVENEKPQNPYGSFFD